MWDMGGYIYSLLHALCVQGVNNKQLPYGAFCMDYIYEVQMLIQKAIHAVLAVTERL